MVPDNKQFIYRLDAEDRFVSVNNSFLEFAAENNLPNPGPEVFVGQSIWNFISDDTTRYLYEVVFADVRQRRSPIVLPYRCDAPGERRHMRIQIAPGPEGSLHATSWIVHVEKCSARSLLDPRQPRDGEFLKMCSWCKRVLVQEWWFEIEDAMDILGLFSRPKLPDISHGMCDRCCKDLREFLPDEPK